MPAFNRLKPSPAETLRLIARYRETGDMAAVVGLPMPASGVVVGAPGSGKTTALIQGYAASAATLAISACRTIQSEAGALLCYHNPRSAAEGDYRAMRRSAESLRNARDAILEMYTARSGAKSREELMALMDKDIWISPGQAKEYGGSCEGNGDETAHDAVLS